MQDDWNKCELALEKRKQKFGIITKNILNLKHISKHNMSAINPAELANMGILLQTDNSTKPSSEHEQQEEDYALFIEEIRRGMCKPVKETFSVN